MSFKTTVARLAGQRGPGDVSRTAQRRFARVLVGAAATGAVLAGIAATAGPALADSPQYTGVVTFENEGAIDQNAPANAMCLDANSQEAHIFGGIIQWDCSTTDNYQKWAFVYAGNGYYQLQNQGDGYCLDADSDNAGSGGSIVQWTCNSSDPFQLFYPINTGSGLDIQSLGASLKTGTSICVDANYYQQYNFGSITQYPCDASDSYQLWTFFHGYK
jgi:hypothetical protein